MNMTKDDYDFNIYCNGVTVSAILHPLRYDAALGAYETDSSKYVSLSYEMKNHNDHNAIAYLLRDYDWIEKDWTDYDTWEDVQEYKKHAPKELLDFFENYMVEYECEEYNVSE